MGLKPTTLYTLDRELYQLSMYNTATCMYNVQNPWSMKTVEGACVNEDANKRHALFAFLANSSAWFPAHSRGGGKPTGTLGEWHKVIS